MNIELLAADIASRVPSMAKDSPVNNVETIKGVIAAEIERCAKATAENTTYAQTRFDLWTHLMESNKPFLESELDEIINLAVRVHQKISNRH